MGLVDLLERPVYQYAEIDKIIGLAPGTARRWINGYERSGTTYAPILRADHTDSEWATWGEFVETRILAEYRDKKIPTLRLRGAVENLRRLFHHRYPLAYLQPYLAAAAGELMLENRLEDSDDETLTNLRTGQTLLDVRGLLVMQSATLARDDAGDLYAVEIVPDIQFASIVVNPRRQGGQPTIVGRRVSVDTIAGMVANGEPREEIAADYNLSVTQVDEAVGFAQARAA